MKEWDVLFKHLEPTRVVVIGDFMLDIYIRGEIQRISPEAPVPIIKVQQEDCLPGGAGNVTLNLKALGVDVIPVGRIGKDLHGKKLKQFLEQQKINSSYLLEQQDYPTTVKSRLISHNQQLMRIDVEENTSIDASIEMQVVDQLQELILSGIHAVAISDYQKGFLTRDLLSSIISLCRQANVPVIVDPKGIDFSKYAGATLIKPNLQEAYQAASMSIKEPLEKAAEKIFSKSGVENLIITRSEKGISHFTAKGERSDFPAKIREVIDVTGAGDTVLAILVFGIVHQLPLCDSIELANMAAGLAVEKVGCAQISLDQLAKRIIEENSEDKVCHQSHRLLFKHHLKDFPICIISVPNLRMITSSLYHVLTKYPLENPGYKHVLWIRDVDHLCPDYIKLLSVISSVHWIFVEEDDFQFLQNEMCIQKIIHLDADGKETSFNTDKTFA